MAVPQIRVDAVQRIVLAGKIRLLHVRRAQKPSVKRISPAVVGALDAALEMAFGRRADASAAMTANIEKSVHATAYVAGDNNAFAGNLAQNKIAWSRNLRLAAGIHPHLRVEAFHLLGENLWVGVIASRKSPWRGRHFCLHRIPKVCALSSILCHNEKAR